MDMLSKDTEIAEDAYRFGFNIRNRYGYLDAIQKSVEITFNLNGKIQGLYAVGNIWLAFCSGRAYYMPLDGTSWFLIPFLQLDPFVDYIYAQGVTGSTNNYLRQAVPIPAGQTNAGNPNASGGIVKNSSPDFTISGTPAGLICQDGINQPWLITYNAVNNVATARRLGTYNDWSNTGTTANNREYVPIGKQMMFTTDNILYIVAPDGFTIFRSVSGRPLDFMINIDTNGNKLASEDLGGARTTSFAISFDTITCIKPSTTIAGVFLVTSSRFVTGMSPDFTNSIFGEPTFSRQFQLEAGVVNQFSMSDSNGDTPFIDFEGIKFFNAVKQLKFEGSNDPFSKNISEAMKGIVQNVCAADTIDNYNFFGIKTIFGYAMAVYDNLNDKWVGFDINSATVGGIKQFAQTVTSSRHQLACATANNKIHILFADPDDERECGTVQLRSFVSGEYSQYGTFVPSSLRCEHKTTYFKTDITAGKIDGTITAIEQVDEQVGQVSIKNVDGVISGVLYPVRPPVIANSKNRNRNLIFPVDAGLRGYKISPILVWDSDLRIIVFELQTDGASQEQSQQQQVAAFT